MPLYYTDVPGATQTTNATPNTANDAMFVKPGSLRAVWINAIYPGGRGAALTAVTGISYRLEKWTTTASAAGTAITPSPNEIGMQAASHTAGYSATTVTPGTGGPTLLLSILSGAASPGNWVSPKNDLDMAYALQAGENKSLDIFNVSGTASMVFECSVGTAE